MNIRASFITNIEDYGKVRLERTFNIQSSDIGVRLKERLHQEIAWDYNNPSDITIIDTKTDNEIIETTNSIEVLEQYNTSNEGAVYVLVLGFDEQSTVEFVHVDKDTFYEKVLKSLLADTLVEITVETWKNGEKINREWIAGSR